jgi:hypothetical protein
MKFIKLKDGPEKLWRWFLKKATQTLRVFESAFSGRHQATRHADGC